MKELYSIGKMSAMMGISAQVLRHYCDIGLITPEYINPETGYRYFSFAQFHYCLLYTSPSPRDRG